MSVYCGGYHKIESMRRASWLGSVEECIMQPVQPFQVNSHDSYPFLLQGSVEERIMEVVRQRQAAGVRPAGHHRANMRVQVRSCGSCRGGLAGSTACQLAPAASMHIQAAYI